MSLGDKRRKFSKMTVLLGQYIEFCGYEFAFDYLKRCRDCEVGHPHSVHKMGLAVDIHLYKDGHYLSSGEEHKHFHDFWDFLGGAARIDDDLNHYSLEWQGVR